jgi:hypothetical protein
MSSHYGIFLDQLLKDVVSEKANKNQGISSYKAQRP